MAKRASERELQGELWLAYYRAIDLIVVNLTWFVLSLPIITLFPAIGGLFYATNQMVRTGSANWGTVWDGFRIHFWRSWRWGLVNMLAYVLLGVNFYFYSHVTTPWLIWLEFPIGLLIIAWSLLQIFAFPLLLEQKDQRLIVALRNSAVLLLKKPAFTLGTTLLVLVVAVPSAYLFPPAWIFISASLCAFLANRAVIKALQEIELKP